MNDQQCDTVETVQCVDVQEEVCEEVEQEQECRTVEENRCSVTGVEVLFSLVFLVQQCQVQCDRGGVLPGRDPPGVRHQDGAGVRGRHSATADSGQQTAGCRRPTSGNR